MNYIISHLILFAIVFAAAGCVAVDNQTATVDTFPSNSTGTPHHKLNDMEPKGIF